MGHSLPNSSSLAAARTSIIEGLWPASPIERPACVPIAVYRPRCVPNGAHAAAPHHLSGTPPPATAVLEIGTTVAEPTHNAAVSAIASDVFIVRSPFDFVSQDQLELERDSNFSLKWRCGVCHIAKDFFWGMD